MTSSHRPEPPLEVLEGWRQRGVPLEAEDAASRDAVIRITSRSIRAEKERRVRRRWLFGAAAAAVVVLGVSAYQFRSLVSPAALHASASSLDVTMGVVTTTHDGRTADVASGAAVGASEKDRFEIPDGAKATLSLPRGVTVELSPASRATLVAAGEEEQRVLLEGGMVSVSVPKPGGPKTFVVTTPDSEVVVHGTLFTTRVERAGGHVRTFVTVSRGAVQVVHGAERTMLHPGDSWATPALETPAPETAASTPLPMVPSRPVAAPRTAAAHPVRTAAQSDLAEQNRLFQRALDARAAGDDATIVDQLDRLLTRYPDTTLAQEARLARFRALSRLGRNREAAREARRYLSGSPDAPARDEARDLLVPSRPPR